MVQTDLKYTVWTKIKRFQYTWNRFIRAWQNWNNWFWKTELGLFFYKNIKVSNMYNSLKKRKLRINSWEYCEKQFGQLRISWSKSIGTFSWRITLDQHSAIGVLHHYAKAFSARQSRSLFLTILDPFLYQDMRWLIVNL